MKKLKMNYFSYLPVFYVPVPFTINHQQSHNIAWSQHPL